MILLALAMAAAQARTPDCGNLASQMEMNACAARDYAAADAELNRVWPRAIAAADGEARAPGDDRPTAEATLRAAQRAWIAFRDAQCRLEGYSERGGSLEPFIASTCLARLTRERIAQLRAIAEGN